jgi:hypothetical protein
MLPPQRGAAANVHAGCCAQQRLFSTATIFCSKQQRRQRICAAQALQGNAETSDKRSAELRLTSHGVDASSSASSAPLPSYAASSSAASASARLRPCSNQKDKTAASRRGQAGRRQQRSSPQRRTSKRGPRTCRKRRAEVDSSGVSASHSVAAPPQHRHHSVQLAAVQPVHLHGSGPAKRCRSIGQTVEMISCTQAAEQLQPFKMVQKT